MEKHADIPNEFTCDEDFDDFMADALQYGTDDILGLIAVFYTNLWAMANLRGQLKEYEDLEEQERLLRLPCAMGDTVWCVHMYSGGGRVPDWGEIFESKFSVRMYENFGKTVFLTREEAEAALKELGKG